jgi:excisionase family DNA binding protein
MVYKAAAEVKGDLYWQRKPRMSTTPLLNVSDVAAMLNVSPHTVRRWASQKKLNKIKLGSRTLFDAEDVARFIETARRTSTDSDFHNAE